MRWFLSFGLLLFLLSPFLFLLSYIDQWSLTFNRELGAVLFATSLQAFLSALLTLGAGLAGALGLLSLRNQGTQWGHKVVELFILLPNMVPVLFVILAVLQLIDPFPFGLTGILILHCFLNVGLISISLYQLIVERIGGMAELAWIEGASRGAFLIQGVWGVLKKDLALLFLFVFTLCFSSFSVPLVVGGIRFTTLEVLIYQKIRISGALGEALWLSVIELAFIFLFSLLLTRRAVFPLRKKARLDLIEAPWLWLIPVIVSALVVIGSLRGLTQGVQQLLGSSEILALLPSTIFGTLVVGFSVGVLTLGLLALLGFVHSLRWVRRFMMGFVAPSSVLTGFAFLLMGGENTFLKMSLGLTLITVPAIYRLGWGSLLEALEGQLATARLLGASWQQCFWEILFPQVIKKGGYLAGLSAFWASGDFALSSIVAGRDLTLGLLIQSLLGSYRLEIALVLVWLLVITGGISFIFFWKMGHVASQKYQA